MKINTIAALKVNNTTFKNSYQNSKFELYKESLAGGSRFMQYTPKGLFDKLGAQDKLNVSLAEASLENIQNLRGKILSAKDDVEIAGFCKHFFDINADNCITLAQHGKEVGGFLQSDLKGFQEEAELNLYFSACASAEEKVLKVTKSQTDRYLTLLGSTSFFLSRLEAVKTLSPSMMKVEEFYQKRFEALFERFSGVKIKESDIYNFTKVFEDVIVKEMNIINMQPRQTWKTLMQ